MHIQSPACIILNQIYVAIRNHPTIRLVIPLPLSTPPPSKKIGPSCREGECHLKPVSPTRPRATTTNFSIEFVTAAPRLASQT